MDPYPDRIGERMVNAQKLALLLSAASLALAAACHPVEYDERTRGEILWRKCTSCHGVDGSGNQSIGAPAIGGMPKWYVESQLLKFRSAQRGGHFEDVTGMKMRPMSLALDGEKDVSIVATYVSNLGRQRHPPTLEGDVDRGKVLLATCTACHGQAGEGNKAMRAPPLARQDDWYMLTQLQKFKSGARGTNPADASGATMRPMAVALKDEQAMRDVIAAIRHLEEM